MNWGERFKLRIQMFAVAMAVLCPSLLVWTASSVPRKFDSYYWPAAPGVVESTTAKTWLDDKRNVKYFGRVVYHYTVSGQEYKTDLTDFGPGTKRIDPQQALADVSAYRPGDKVTVYYDPRDPSTGLLQNGIPDVDVILLVVLSLGSLVGVIASFFVIRSWLRLLFARKANAEQASA